MAKDEEWVEDVKRWFLAGASPDAAGAGAADTIEEVALGYEAAHPALLVRDWPHPPTKDR